MHICVYVRIYIYVRIYVPGRVSAIRGQWLTRQMTASGTRVGQAGSRSPCTFVECSSSWTPCSWRRCVLLVDTLRNLGPPDACFRLFYNWSIAGKVYAMPQILTPEIRLQDSWRPSFSVLGLAWLLTEVLRTTKSTISKRMKKYHVSRCHAPARPDPIYVLGRRLGLRLHLPNSCAADQLHLPILVPLTISVWHV